MEGKKKTSKQKRQAEEQNRREIIGICLIALGLFLGASLYSDAVGLAGKAISAFFFGVFGLGGYAVPAVVVLFGVLVWLINQGSLDAISYAVRTGLGRLIPGGGLQQPESYWDYLEKRKRIRGYGFLFLAGAAALVIAGVFMALFYWNR